MNNVDSHNTAQCGTEISRFEGLNSDILTIEKDNATTMIQHITNPQKHIINMFKSCDQEDKTHTEYEACKLIKMCFLKSIKVTLIMCVTNSNDVKLINTGTGYERTKIYVSEEVYALLNQNMKPDP